MYGFKKVPHLQHGALRGEHHAEESEYAHEYFRRGRQDLLILAGRHAPKKQSRQHPQSQQLLIEAAPTSSPESGTVAQNLSESNLQGFDMQALANELNIIHSNQNTIYEKLTELKRDNEKLWVDQMDSKRKQEQQQLTLNVIVQFLARSIGDGSNLDLNAARSMLGSRFMIGGASEGSMVRSASSSNSAPSPFASIETPSSIPGSDIVMSEASASPEDDSSAQANAQQALAIIPPKGSSSKSTLLHSPFQSSSLQPPGKFQSTNLLPSSPHLQASLPLQSREFKPSVLQPSQPQPSPFQTPSAQPSSSFGADFQDFFQAPPPLPSSSQIQTAGTSLTPLDFGLLPPTPSPSQQVPYNWQATESLVHDATALQGNIDSAMETLGMNWHPSASALTQDDDLFSFLNLPPEVDGADAPTPTPTAEKRKSTDFQTGECSKRRKEE